MTDPKQLWQAQPTETPSMTLEDIRALAQSFQSRIRRRNTIELAAAGLVAVIFAGYAIFFPQPLIKAGALAIIAATAFVTVYLLRRGASRSAPDASALDCLAFHRAELSRQRDLLVSVPLWYLAPLLPGMLLCVAGLYLARTAGLIPTVLALVWIFGVLAVIWRLNWKRAGELKRELDAIDAMRT